MCGLGGVGSGFAEIRVDWRGCMDYGGGMMWGNLRGELGGMDRGRGVFLDRFVPGAAAGTETGLLERRDHDRNLVEIVLPHGGIRAGAGLAAERYLSAPISGVDMSLVNQYWAEELKGRPLQGEYELRFYVPEGQGACSA